MVNIRGLAVIDTIDFFNTLGGQPALDNIRLSLNPEDRRILFAKPILATSWVSYDVLMRFMLAADAQLGLGDGELIRKAAIYKMNRHFNKFYKFFISKLSPKMILNTGPVAYHKYFDAGTLTVEWVTENKVIVRITDRDMPDGHEFDFIESMGELLRMSSARNVFITHPQCVRRQDRLEVYEMSWE
jgi:hypothetical protein